ncbi:MAG: 2-amino-4-hydroxy-6-hydroxymethyldihydropteridine diphosphokinase [Planctomycetaceae bacterium]|nr:2-amino-4-hydroxy-6-hydroxymethyldihydropteridine diphosphokinase [Planctomycetaceae bacterium]
MPPFSAVLLAFGANLGDPRSQISDAWNRVAQIPGVRGERLSSFYVTEPVGGPQGQPDFLNCAGLVHTELSPERFLDEIQSIETAMGRVRTEHWGPRIIDIDILLFGDCVIQTDRLTIPHPRMHERSFVLDPATEIAPEMIHPIFKKSVQQMRNAFRSCSSCTTQREQVQRGSAAKGPISATHEITGTT